MHPEIIAGNNHRYHIESLVGTSSRAYTYRAFVRRRSGKTIRRRYYALVSPNNEQSLISFLSDLRLSMMTTPFPVRIEEEIKSDDGHFYVIARGMKENKRHPLQAYTNKGYLMLFLSAVILILLVIKFFS